VPRSEARDVDIARVAGVVVVKRRGAVDLGARAFRALGPAGDGREQHILALALQHHPASPRPRWSAEVFAPASGLSMRSGWMIDDEMSGQAAMERHALGVPAEALDQGVVGDTHADVLGHHGRGAVLLDQVDRRLEVARQAQARALPVRLPGVSDRRRGKARRVGHLVMRLKWNGPCELTYHSWRQKSSYFLMLPSIGSLGF
jgi:hypothetical protein